MAPAILGIDVSKATLHIALMEGEGRPKKKVFDNNETGFGPLRDWLKEQRVY